MHIAFKFCKRYFNLGAAMLGSFLKHGKSRENIMAWSKPSIRELECGMEINMYGPDHDDNDLF